MSIEADPIPMLRAAYAYARRGLRVHPCRPGRKEPLLKNWQKVATADPTQIAAWWRRWPSANVAIACGGPARLLVVDVDPDTGGEASLAGIELDQGGLPATAEVVTPRGGRHLYLIVPDGRPMPGNSAGKLGPGIDTRGRGGYVLAPPSIVSERPYRWSVDSADCIDEAPAWLVDRLVTQSCSGGQATSPEEWLKLITAGVDEGARNHAIARVAGLLFRRLPEPQIAAELVACWNAVKCRPPLKAAELKRTLDSIADREMKRRGLST